MEKKGKNENKIQSASSTGSDDDDERRLSRLILFSFSFSRIPRTVLSTLAFVPPSRSVIIIKRIESGDKLY